MERISPELTLAADLPENYEKHLDMSQFILDVPAEEEETRMLGGKIGEYVTISRKQRGGNECFIGSITNEKRHDYDVALAFFDGGAKYVAEIYRDGDDADWKTNPYCYRIEPQLVTKQSVLEFHLAPGGGEAVRVRLASKTEAKEPAALE